jgi:hypothetical protein
MGTVMSTHAWVGVLECTLQTSLEVETPELEQAQKNEPSDRKEAIYLPDAESSDISPTFKVQLIEHTEDVEETKNTEENHGTENTEQGVVVAEQDDGLREMYSPWLGRTILCTAQYAIWEIREMLYEKQNKRHHHQMEEKKLDREYQLSRIRELTPTQLERQELLRKDLQRAESIWNENRRKLLRKKYGIDSTEIQVSDAEKSLEKLAILGGVRCKEPSHLRQCLTILSEEELEGETRREKEVEVPMEREKTILKADFETGSSDREILVGR